MDNFRYFVVFILVCIASAALVDCLGCGPAADEPWEQPNP